MTSFEEYFEEFRGTIEKDMNYLDNFIKPKIGIIDSKLTVAIKSTKYKEDAREFRKAAKKYRGSIMNDLTEENVKNPKFLQYMASASFSFKKLLEFYGEKWIKKMEPKEKHIVENLKSFGNVHYGHVRDGVEKFSNMLGLEVYIPDEKKKKNELTYIA